MKYKKYHEVSDHCNYIMEYRVAAHFICNLKYSVSKKHCTSFHNRSMVIILS